jgi:hypothetical protein
MSAHGHHYTTSRKKVCYCDQQYDRLSDLWRHMEDMGVTDPDEWDRMRALIRLDITHIEEEPKKKRWEEAAVSYMSTTIEIANGTPIDCWISDGKVVVVLEMPPIGIEEER